MDAHQLIDLALAALNLAVAGLVFLRGRRWLGHMSAPLLALTLYFTLRCLSRLSEALKATNDAGFDVSDLLDVLLIAALLAILATVEPILRGIAVQEDAARYRATEYERARRHYDQVVRHRLMNPVTVVKGSAQTLGERAGMDDETRTKLLAAIVEAAEQIEHVSLAPERRDDNERELDALPRVDDDRRATQYPDGPTGPR